ncbi:MAG TPA: glycoside hydrolase [Tepidisphaeraceae bacterium]|nr:glycoside hydrolase [Tepidisphaeraceae bacterium]
MTQQITSPLKRTLQKLVFIALFAVTAHLQAQSISLSNDTWRINIDPATLSVYAQLNDGSTLPISSPQAATKISQLTDEPTEARWLIEDSNTWISMHLDTDTLRVLITANSPADFSWPTISPAKTSRAYILPLVEGSYVPADDADWIKHLSDQGPLDVYGLSLPLWGIDAGKHTLTYMMPKPFNSELVFSNDNGRLASKLVHHFVPANKRYEYEVMISLGPASPIEPARRYRRWLVAQNQFVSMKQKIAKTPDAAKLLGAAHIYLWGSDAISRYDVKDWKKFAAAFVAKTKANDAPIVKQIWSLLDDEAKKMLEGLPKQEFADAYTTGTIARGISAAIEKIPDGSSKLHKAFPDLTADPKTWGDGISTKMIDQLAEAKIDRAWLGGDSALALIRHPNVADRAQELGYVIGYYDSYHSIHAPGTPDTWETAQFDQKLFDIGGIMKADGTFRRGFKQKGRLLSPIAARPYVEKRVTEQMKATHANSIFIDCDAFGDIFDDYSPSHPATQFDDMSARVARMGWMRDTFKAVVGSEGGVWYAADTIHFAHGMTTGVIGWGDKDLTDKQSPWYLGSYYPPDGPAVFLKSAPMKDAYIKLHVDPRYRLPLYEAAFHDSIIATHHWSAGTLKFSDVLDARVATELLYNVPPLYHLNLAEWKKHKDFISKQFAFFSPLHRSGALMEITDFKWLTADRLVQQVTYGRELEVTANFGNDAYEFNGKSIPKNGVLARNTVTGTTTLWTGP